MSDSLVIFEDHLTDCKHDLDNVRFHVNEMAAGLEDGGTPFDARVQQLSALIEVATRELAEIERQFRANNPVKPPAPAKPFKGFTFSDKTISELGAKFREWDARVTDEQVYAIVFALARDIELKDSFDELVVQEENEYAWCATE